MQEAEALLGVEGLEGAEEAVEGGHGRAGGGKVRGGSVERHAKLDRRKEYM